MPKKFFRCKVCNDVHFGEAGPEICPTCHQKNVYFGITLEEAKSLMAIK